MVEGGWRERDKAAVSARAEPGNLHGAHHPYFGQAASCPRGRSRHHSCFDEPSQASALQARKVRRGRTSRHGQQAVLHQLVGHVLAHRPRQEAPDGLKRAGALFILVYLKFVLGLPKVCLVWMIQTLCKPTSNCDQTFFVCFPNRMQTCEAICANLPQTLQINIYCRTMNILQAQLVQLAERLTTCWRSRVRSLFRSKAFW